MLNEGINEKKTRTHEHKHTECIALSFGMQCQISFKNVKLPMRTSEVGMPRSLYIHYPVQTEKE